MVNCEALLPVKLMFLLRTRFFLELQEILCNSFNFAFDLNDNDQM